CWRSGRGWTRPTGAGRRRAVAEATRLRNQWPQLLRPGAPESRAHLPALRTSAGVAALERYSAPGPRPQVALVDHEHVIQALPPRGADEPLGDRVGPWGSNRRRELLDAEGSELGTAPTALDPVPLPPHQPPPPPPGL